MDNIQQSDPLRMRNTYLHGISGLSGCQGIAISEDDTFLLFGPCTSEGKKRFELFWSNHIRMAR